MYQLRNASPFVQGGWVNKQDSTYSMAETKVNNEPGTHNEQSQADCLLQSYWGKLRKLCDWGVFSEIVSVNPR